MSGTVTAGQLILTDAKYNGDGFGRIRVSEPVTLFDLYHIYDKVPDRIEELVSGSFDSTNSCVTMELGVTTGKVVRQSKEYILYQPGKSKLILLSGILIDNISKTGVTSRIGAFDSLAEKTSDSQSPLDGNGHFFQFYNGVVSVVERGYSSDTAITQANWNLDKLDGTGSCPVSIDFTKAQIYVIEIQWLGVGQVRFGIGYNNAIYYCHKITHTNVLQYPYMKTAKLPIRYEISGSNASATTMKMICSTVISEGGYIPYGIPYSFNNFTPITVTQANFFLLFAVRINPSYSRITVKLNGYGAALTTGNDTIYWQLLLNPNISTSLTYTSITNAHTQYANGNGSITVTGGKVLDSGLLTSSVNNAVNIDLSNLSLLPTLLSSMAGTPDVIVLCAKRSANGSADLVCNCSLLEFL
jgi:hypothetical protein